jgi:hypothetical protein
LGTRRYQYLHTTELALEVEVQKWLVLELYVRFGVGQLVVRIEVIEVIARVPEQSDGDMVEEQD